MKKILWLGGKEITQQDLEKVGSENYTALGSTAAYVATDFWCEWHTYGSYKEWFDEHINEGYSEVSDEGD